VWNLLAFKKTTGESSNNVSGVYRIYQKEYRDFRHLLVNKNTGMRKLYAVLYSTMFYTQVGKVVRCETFHNERHL
jgi:hypothetical protein